MELHGKNYYLNVFQKARELLTTPESWVQEEYAMNGHGEKTWPTNDDAVAVCAQGALIRADHMLYQYHDQSDDFEAEKAEDLLLGIVAKSGTEFKSVSRWNDSVYTNHEKILEVFDDVIEALKEEKERANV